MPALRKVVMSLIAAVLFVTTLPAFGAASLVGYSEGGSAGSGGATVATGARAFTGGNLIVVCVRNTGSSDIESVADTAGNTYTPLTQRQPGGGDPFLRLFYSADITGHATNVVTASFEGGTSSSYTAIFAVEFSGMATASALDVEVGGATTGTTMTSPTLTTTNAIDVVVACGSQGALTTYTAGANYTLIDGSANATDILGIEYRITTGTIGGVAQTIVSGSSADGAIAVAAFKEAAGGGGGSAVPVITHLQRMQKR